MDGSGGLLDPGPTCRSRSLAGPEGAGRRPRAPSSRSRRRPVGGALPRWDLLWASAGVCLQHTHKVQHVPSFCRQTPYIMILTQTPSWSEETGLSHAMLFILNCRLPTPVWPCEGSDLRCFTRGGCEGAYRRQWAASLSPAPPLSVGTLRFLACPPGREEQFITPRLRYCRSWSRWRRFTLNLVVKLMNWSDWWKGPFQGRGCRLCANLGTPSQACELHHGHIPVKQKQGNRTLHDWRGLQLKLDWTLVPPFNQQC